MRSEFCCVIGRDSSDNEQRELSSGTSRFFSEKLHTLNYTNFLLKIRENFLDIERGESYGEHTKPPKSFFYCPLTVSDGRPDAAAVWGECGLYGEGREFRFAQMFFEDYSKITPRDLLCRIFSTDFLDGGEITAIFDRDKKNSVPDLRGEYDENFVPDENESLRRLAAAAAERLCEGKTVVVKVTRHADFNKAAREILIQIMSILPGEFRKQIGFTTYLQREQLVRFKSQSNNLRLIIVDSDVDISELPEPFATLEVGKEYQVSELYEHWSRMSFAERELMYERFLMTKRRIQAKKLIAELSRIHSESGMIPEPEDVTDTNESHIDGSEAQKDADKSHEEPVKKQAEPKEQIPEKWFDRIGWFLAREEVKLLMTITGIVTLLIGFAVGIFIGG